MIKILIALCIFILIGLFTGASALVIRVPSEYPNIRGGIEAATVGDTVLIADGIYSGDENRDLDFMGKSIFLTSENGAESTVIDCKGSYNNYHRAFYFRNKESETAVVNGITIRNGYYTSSVGGAILCSLSSPTISECIFENNTSWLGGAIYCKSSAARIANNLFINNISTGT